jgi:integrase
LKMMFKTAASWDYILFSPADHAESPKLPPFRVRYLRRDQFHALLEAAPVWLRPIVALAVATGMRRSEILGIQFRDVDVEQKMVILRDTKNGTMRFVPLNRSAWAVVESLLFEGTHQPTEKLFPEVTPDQVSMRFRRLCHQLGIAEFSFHDLRHTAASWLRMQGVDTHTVALLLGHKDMRMAARYQHLSQPFLRKSILLLDAVILGTEPVEWEEAGKPIARPHSVPAGKEEKKEVAKLLN